jgi:hypothetical protein
VEQQHEVFEEEMERRLRNIELPDDLRVQAIALVDRAYAAFDLMLQGLRTEINAPVEPLMPARLPEAALAPTPAPKAEARPEEAETPPQVLAV